MLNVMLGVRSVAAGRVEAERRNPPSIHTTGDASPARICKIASRHSRVVKRRVTASPLTRPTSYCSLGVRLSVTAIREPSCRDRVNRITLSVGRVSGPPQSTDILRVQRHICKGRITDMTRQSDQVVNDPKLTWRTVAQRGDSAGKQSRRSAMGSLDERQENVLHDLKCARPSATDWHRVVHSLFKEDRLILDLIDEIAIPWN
jgi:hypothetical protein